MKYKVTVEETISQEIEINATSRDEALSIAQKLYKEEKIVLEPGNLVSVDFTI